MSLTRRNSKILECLTQIVQDNREEDMSISAMELVNKVTTAVYSLIEILDDTETAQKEIRLVAETIRDYLIAECPIISKCLYNFEDAYEIHILDRLVLEKFGVYNLIKENNFKKLSN